MKIFHVKVQTLQQHEPFPNSKIIEIEFYQIDQIWLLLGLYEEPLNHKTADFKQYLSSTLDLCLKS